MKRSYKIGISVGIIFVAYLLYFFLKPPSSDFKLDSELTYNLMNTHIQKGNELASDEQSKLIYYFLQHQPNISYSDSERKLIKSMKYLYETLQEYLKYTDPKEKQIPKDAFLEEATTTKKLFS